MNFRLPSLPSERLQRLVPRLASLFFACLLGLSAAELTWLLVPVEPLVTTPRPPASVTAGRQQASTTPAVSLSSLQAARLFGEFLQEAEPAPQLMANLDAPETSLRLKLRGIVAMEDSARSRALIEASNGELNPYAVGATISAGTKLHSIYPDRVLLERGKRLETLRLEKDEPSQTQFSYQSNQRRSSDDDGSAARILDSSTAAKLSNIREELLNDPTKASQYLRVQPARVNGAMRGYRIYPGRNRELFTEAGLRPGDIVTAINGVSLDDPSRSLQLLGDLSSAQQINLQIERGGQSQAVSVSLN